ncbi:uncharacterized protein LOC128999535 isoform X3 [Macrosteles quadrilineatus]|uniref:uncharacterized protein LOC128999535 isoform X3 n=1 Tax=Macrosteles quadrilineatus TaxID=74068 RepID=UPI0023E16457|nr:uncharacterized protein LOC128999535 isoform X3 [Macrosteles quadrilineatus]
MFFDIFEVIINAKNRVISGTLASVKGRASMDWILMKFATFKTSDEIIFWHLLWISLVIIAVVICLCWKFFKVEDPGESLKKYCYEVHHIAGTLNPSTESIKRCIAILNQFPHFINHPKPPYNYTPFLRACWSGNAVLIRYMIMHGANLHSCTSSRESPVYLAAYRVLKSQKWNPSVLNLLYSAGDLNHLSVAALLHLYCPQMAEKGHKGKSLMSFPS